MSKVQEQPGATVRISIMMFLQFFLWGVWFATLAQALGANGLADFGGGSYGTAPLGAIFAPLFLGLIADRFFPSQIVMGILFLLGAVLMYLAWQAAVAGNGALMVRYFLGHMLCYMPTLGLGNTIAFTHLSRDTFPKVRVWGTIGWIVAGLVVGLLAWTSNLQILQLAAGCSAILGVYCFFLPHTPAPARGEPVNLRTLFMVDAFKLMANPAFFVFILCSTLICIPLAYYYGLTSNYLSNAGFEQAAASMTIGQMSEIFFMLLIPFFFRRLGVKWMILIGMAAWVTRYLLFALAAPNQVAWMLFLAIALHGICYDFFFVTGFMYADGVASKAVRGQVQSMLVFFTQGVGMYFGYMLAFNRFGAVGGYDGLNKAIESARTAGGEAAGSYLEQMARMFSVNMPDGVDPGLIATAMGQWKEFWMLPAMMAGAIAVLFLVAFWDKAHDNDAAAADEA
jgi:nucleoside transporter